MSEPAEQIYERLARAGRIPLYLHELGQSTGLDPVTVQEAVIELHEAGRIVPASWRVVDDGILEPAVGETPANEHNPGVSSSETPRKAPVVPIDAVRARPSPKRRTGRGRPRLK